MKSGTRPKLPKSVARNAMHEIGLAIVCGEYAPGAILPTEETLAVRTGVGRPALREAIKVLSGKGLIRTARRYGSRVCPRAEWNLLDPDVIAWHLALPANWPGFVRDIVEMRQFFEPMTASLAAKRATEDEIRRILALADKIPVVTTEMSISDDVSYHTAIMRASHNSIMAGLAPSMEVLLRAYFAAIWKIRPQGSGRQNATTNLHRALAEAIADRDPEAARTLMLKMLELNADEIDELEVLFKAGFPNAAVATPDNPSQAALRESMEAVAAQFLRG